jgi:tRNA-binding protein
MSEQHTLPPLRPECTITEFERVDIRVGQIIDAQPFPAARKPAYQLTIDFGPLGIKRSSAQITVHYTPQALIGRHVLAVVNFPSRRIAGFSSEALTLGFPDANGDVVLVAPDHDVPLGSQLY